MLRMQILGFLGRIRKFIAYILIFLTGLGFYIYLDNNPTALQPLRQVSLFTIPLLLIAYGLSLLTQLAITDITIKLCGKSYALKLQLQLTIYSTLVNFFGPLQSGPGVRAIYLKKKLGIGIKDYAAAMIIYYLSFGVLSLALLLGSVQPLGLTLPFILGAVIYRFRKKIPRFGDNFNLIWLIFLATLAQILVGLFIFYTEIKSAGYDPSFSALLAYTGSANLSLFVAFTPAAIGIRESFIYLAQSLHGIPTDVVLNANLLDRSVFVLFLIILFLVSSTWHIKNKIVAITQQKTNVSGS